MVEKYLLRWQNPQNIGGIGYHCGYCETYTAPSHGWQADTIAGANLRGYVGICSYCNKPSFIEVEKGTIIKVTPSVAIGKNVEGLPDEVKRLYEEARICTGAGAYTSAVLTCRKILMHVAVEKKAQEGMKFIDYVEYLASEGYIPKEGKKWVDYIRTKSNEANHEIKMMVKDDADTLVTFIEMLLRLTYEFNERLPK